MKSRSKSSSFLDYLEALLAQEATSTMTFIRLFLLAVFCVSSSYCMGKKERAKMRCVGATSLNY